MARVGAASGGMVGPVRRIALRTRLRAWLPGDPLLEPVSSLVGCGIVMIRAARSCSAQFKVVASPNTEAGPGLDGKRWLSRLCTVENDRFPPVPGADDRGDQRA